MSNPNDPRFEKIFARYVSFCCLLAIAFGLVTLTGWAFHLQLLKSLIPGQVAVKSNTAACFVLLGLALLLVRREPPTASRHTVVAQFLAVVVSIVGLLSFLEYWKGWGLGIDQLLFHAGAEDLPGSVRPGLMSPLTAISLLLLGSVIFLLRWSRRQVQEILQGIAAVAAIIQIFGILDFITDPARTYTYVAPTTSLVLFLFAWAVMFSRRNHGFSALVCGVSAGAPLARRLLPATIIIPTVVGWLGWKGEALGWYSEWTGLAMITVAASGLLATLTAWTAFAVDRKDFQRKQAEQSVRRLAAIVTCSQDAIIGKTMDGIVTSWNEGAHSVYGFSAKEMIDHSLTAIIPPERLDEFHTIMTRIGRGENVDHHETVRTRKDGRQIAVSLSISPIKNDRGEVIGASTIARDITERRCAEEAVRRASRYTRSLIEASLDPLVTISKDGKITDVNEASIKATGIPRERLIGTDFCDYFTEPEKAREGYQRVFAEGFVRDYPLAIRHTSGQIMEVVSNASVFRNEAGEVEGVFAAARDVTERKHAEEAVRRAALYTRSLIEASLDPLVTISKDGKITDVNQATEKATGISRELLIGSDFSNYFTEPEKARQGYQRVFAEGFVRDYPLAIRHTSGRIMDVLYNAGVFRNEQGEVEGVFAAARDVTDRKHAEQKMAEQAALLDLAQDAIVVSDLDSRVLFWSRGAKDTYGWRPEEAMGQVTREFLKTEFPTSLDSILSSLKQEREWEGELGHTCRDGRQIIVASRWSLLRDADGNPAAILEINRDITERKRTQEQLRKASLYTRSLIEASLDPLVTISREGKITDVNQGTENATGVKRDKLVGSDFSDYFTEPEKARVGYLQVFATGSVRDYPLALRHASGGVIDVLYNASVFRNEQGEVEGVFAAARDITEHKRAEQEIRTLNRELEQRVEQRTAQLRESEQSVRRKLDSILAPEGELGDLELPDLLDIPALQSLADDLYDLTGIPVFILNLRGKPLVATGWQDICTKFHRAHPDACRNCEESDRELSRGVAPGTFKLYKCKNNMWDVVTPITVGGQQMGNLFSGQFFFSDEAVDDSVFREQALQYGFDENEYMAALARVPRLDRSQVNTAMQFFVKFSQVLSQLSYSSVKLARSLEETRRVNVDLSNSVKELEAFTYSVSHDLRAPLRHISGFSQMLSEEYSAILPEEARHHLCRIEEGTRRMGLLVDDLLNLARVGRRDLTMRVIGLRAIVDEVIADLKPELEGRKVDWQIGTLPFLECDPGLMKQVFQNLLSNALKFTRPRELAIIAVEQAEKDAAPVICVRDNGVGFSMKYANKLFGVFQRLHSSEDFEGTGVGLATVQRIIQKHGGRIWTEAELDKGAAFYFTLAASEKRETRARAAGAGQKK